MCEVLKVSRSSFYHWKKRKPSSRSERRTVLSAEIFSIYHWSRGRYGSLNIVRELESKGIRASRPFVAKLMREEAHFVPSIHEPLISEELFEKVQTIMDGNVNIPRPNFKILSDDNLPLRGFLICPHCDHLITGSASTGRSGQKYYYHCKAPCGYRYTSEIINGKFLELLQSLKMRESIKKYLRKVLKQNFEKLINNPQNERKAVMSEIDKLNNRLKLARNKLLEEVIDDDEYFEIKSDCKEQIEKLESKLTKGNMNYKPQFYQRNSFS